MKTIQELIRDAENLNRFMTDAAANKVQNHQLAATDDEYARNVYLTLLVSVAETAGNVDETTDNPFAYICRIATALPAIDMEEIFRRSLLLDEKILNDHAVTLRQYGLQNLLLFDALNMLIVYAKDNAATSEYIAGLANVFGTGQDGLEEILLVVKAVINREENFSYKFQHVNCFEFLPYLRRHAKNLVVESADVFLMEFESERDVTAEQAPLTLENKKFVRFENVYLHDKKFSVHVKATETAEFENCRFENLTDERVKEFVVHGNEYSFPDEIRLMSFKQVDTVKIIGCKFAGMTSNFIDYRTGAAAIFSQYVDRGILIFVNEINLFVVRDCEFKDCFFREMSMGGHYGLFRDASSGEYMTLQDKFRPNNFTVADYLKHAEINFERDVLVGGRNVKSDDVRGNKIINSFNF